MVDARIATTADVSTPRWAGAAISWSAVFAGALAALGLSIVLIILGSAFGFGAMSPFSGDGLSATTIGIVTIVWLVFTQIFASVAGGYIAGRMRARWDIHKDEVYFRDTVHGFLTWALASGIMFAMVAIAAGGGASAVTTMAAAAVQSEDGVPGPADLITDRLYRAPGANLETADASGREALRLFLKAMDDENTITSEDRAWLVQDVSARTGLSASEAEARVQTALNNVDTAREEAQEAVNVARAASATLSIATTLAMMIGAFAACMAAAFGGRERDNLEDRLAI